MNKVLFKFGREGKVFMKFIEKWKCLGFGFSLIGSFLEF